MSGFSAFHSSMISWFAAIDSGWNARLWKVSVTGSPSVPEPPPSPSPDPHPASTRPAPASAAVTIVVLRTIPPEGSGSFRGRGSGLHRAGEQSSDEAALDDGEED